MKTVDRRHYYVSHVTSKGQATIPRAVRTILGLKEGSEIAFKPAAGGFMMIRVTTTIREEDPYTHTEWEKIKKLASEKGRTFKSEKSILKYLHRA